MTIEPIFTNSAELGIPKLPLSHAVEAAGLYFISGQTGVLPSGQLISGDIMDQTRQTLENLGVVLKTLGKSFSDVVRANVYLTDMANFPAMNAVYGEFFSEPYPARTTVAVVGLPLGAIVEIDLVVAK